MSGCDAYVDGRDLLCSSRRRAISGDALVGAQCRQWFVGVGLFGVSASDGWINTDSAVSRHDVRSFATPTVSSECSTTDITPHRFTDATSTAHLRAAAPHICATRNHVHGTESANEKSTRTRTDSFCRTASSITTAVPTTGIYVPTGFDAADITSAGFDAAGFDATGNATGNATSCTDAVIPTTTSNGTAERSTDPIYSANAIIDTAASTCSVERR